ncbi:MAG: superoxide dismutase family protein [Actinobacteria bacterium]|nr:superoxide dismutase family protein [Actinomycetota bacterium]
MDHRLRRAGVILGITLLTVSVGAFTSSLGAEDATARAVLRNAAGDPIGLVRFNQLPHGVLVRVVVRGLAPGFHGFHVHANNDPANGEGCVADPAAASSTWFVSADGHYKSEDAQTHPGHAADMPVILVNGTGGGFGIFRTDRFAVADIVGKAVIVHALPDNYANIPLGIGATQYTANSDNPADPNTATGKTLATGNAGDRLGCGVIEAP